MSSQSRTILGVFLILVITFCATFLASRHLRHVAGVDLTEDGLYTLTEGTRDIVRGVRQPLTLKFFYSKEAVSRAGEDELVGYNNYYFYVRDLLRTYERISEGRLVVEEYDPRPFSDEEIEADRLGLTRFNLSNRESFFFGLAVTNESGVEQSLPFFSISSQGQVEYKISELIALVSLPRRPKLGMLTAAQVLGEVSPAQREMLQQAGRPIPRKWQVVEELERTYEVVSLAADVTRIPADLDVLLLYHPKRLPLPTVYAVDQYLLNGGSALVLVDPYNNADEPPAIQHVFTQMDYARSSNIGQLLGQWGLKTLRWGPRRAGLQEFAGDLRIAHQGQLASGEEVRFVGILKPTRLAGSFAEHPVTRGLEQVDLLLAGGFRPAEGALAQPLITTTDQGGVWQASSQQLNRLRMTAADLVNLSREFEAGNERLWLAAVVDGEAQSAFASAPPDQAVPQVDEDDQILPHSASGPVRAIVVADADWVADAMIAERTREFENSNLSFLRNSIEWLLGSESLMKIRARANFRRPFDVIDEIERQADLATLDKIREIEAQRTQFLQELRALQEGADQDAIGVLRGTALQKERELRTELRGLDREMRDLQKGKRDRVNALGDRIRNINILGVPALVLLVGTALAVLRYRARRRRVLGGVS